MTYNTTFLDNATSLGSVITGLNTESSGWLAGTLLFTLWFVMLIVFQGNDFLNTLVASSFVVSLAAAMLFFAGMTAAWVIAIPIGVGVIAGITKITQG